jgi:membrane protease YdiL (CAAX protease family)
MGQLADLIAAATAGPTYAAEAGDRREIRVAGLDLPVRATTALFLVTLIVLLDYTRTLIPADIQQLGRSPEAVRYTALLRLVVFGLVPTAVIVVGFRDRLTRYGLTLGAWRWGVGLLLAGLAIMTPIILGLATRPDFRGYYGVSAGDLGNVLLTNVLDLGAAEFLLRGFLLFTLLRRIGPLALIVVQVPFIFSHIGKPELELYSTFIGGTVFAWLDWRTGSIVWSALGHVYILTLMLVAVGATT